MIHSRSKLRVKTWLAWALLSLCAVVLLTPGAVRAEDEESAIKSAIIFNIMKFVEWPAESMRDSNEFVLGLAGAEALEPAVSSLAGKSLKGANLVVRIVASPTEAQDCQALFLGEDIGEEELASYVALADSTPILTLSDRESFCEAGGMVELVRQRNKLRFCIHRRSAERVQLKLSSQLLRMALLFEVD